MAQSPRATGAVGLALSARLLRSFLKIPHKIFAPYVHRAEIDILRL
jgi:hypothetical protein